MCTLTWTHRATHRATHSAAAGGPGGYRLWFNRDERRTRSAEVPPRVTRPSHGVAYIAPEDSEAGGTWIAVNAFGITVALLNGYRSSLGADREDWTSRGHLVRELAEARRVSEVWRRMAPKQLRVFRPLVLAVIPPDQPALIARWDGRDVTLDPRGHRQLPLTSSSYEQSEVQTRRRSLYAEQVRVDSTTGEALDPTELASFQRWTPKTGPDAFSPSMSRPDATTRSQCQIEVTPDNVLFRYTPGPPHCTPQDPPVQLARSSGSRTL